MEIDELDKFIEKNGDGGCKLDEFLTGDSELPVCMETDDDNWQTVFFEIVCWPINPRRACAARVTVVGSVCVCVGGGGGGLRSKVMASFAYS